MTRLTKRRLAAIAEALHHRLAGAIDDDDLDPRDYHAALQWAEEQTSKRSANGVPKNSGR